MSTDRLEVHLLRSYQDRFGQTFSLMAVGDHNVAEVNRLMREALDSDEPFTDDDISNLPKGADI